MVLDKTCIPIKPMLTMHINRPEDFPIHLIKCDFHLVHLETQKDGRPLVSATFFQ